MANLMKASKRMERKLRKTVGFTKLIMLWLIASIIRKQKFYFFDEKGPFAVRKKNSCPQDLNSFNMLIHQKFENIFSPFGLLIKDSCALGINFQI